MRFFDYSLFEALEALSTEQSFDAAANKLGMTQSAVSQKIKQLEARVGAILVVRGRPCSLTPLGKRLCTHLSQVDMLETELSEELSLAEARKARHSPICIAVNHDTLNSWFPEVIKIASESLKLRFHILPNDQDYTADHLINGEAIAAISSEARLLHGFRRIPLGNLQYVAIATPAFFQEWFANGVTAESVEAAPSLVYNHLDMRLRNWCASVLSCTPTLSSHSVPSYQGYLKCCLNGTGWGVFPRSSVTGLLAEEGKLVRLSPQVGHELPLFWHYSAMRSQSLTTLSRIVRRVAKTEMDHPAQKSDCL